jgi:hypothetical protein
MLDEVGAEKPSKPEEKSDKTKLEYLWLDG